MDAIAAYAIAEGAMQKHDELAALLTLIEKRGKMIGRVVEIGTARGGTLAAWCEIASPGATIVSVDLPDGNFGGGYRIADIPRIRGYKCDQQRVVLIRGDSHDRLIFDQVWNSVYEGVDLLFIDGDHTYEGVHADFYLYRTLIRPGGLVVLHDIKPEQEHPECRVADFWADLKTVTNDWVEIVSGDGEAWGGFGIVMVPEISRV